MFDIGLESLTTNKTFNIVPTKSVGEIKFGMSRDTVRNMFKDTGIQEFKKTKSAENTTDSFGAVHVYYNTNNTVKGVELFSECNVSINGKSIMGVSKDTVTKILKELDSDVVVNKHSITSNKLSIGISITSDKVSSVFVGNANYYSKKEKALENIEYITEYLESNPDTKDVIIDFLKQDESFEALLQCETSNNIIVKLQTVSKEALRVSKDFAVGSINVSIDGKICRLRIDVKSSKWPSSSFNGFNKFVENSSKMFEDGFNSHAKDLHDYLNPELCKRDGLPEPTYENFKKMIHLNCVVFTDNKCAICGEMPWDKEHGIGIVIDTSGKISQFTNYMTAYES